MTITLRWETASSADATHDDIQASLGSLDCDGAVAIVAQDADPYNPALGWRWSIDDEWLLDAAIELDAGYVATKQAGRSAVMAWVREHLGTCDCHPWPHSFRNDPDPCIGWMEWYCR